MLLFVLFATATCMSTAPKNTIEENTTSQNELKNKTGPTFIDTVSATKLQMEWWMGKQDEHRHGTAFTAHNLALFVFALITTPPDHILPSPSAFKTRALAILCSTLITSTTNLFTVTSKTAITKQRGTRECIAYNLSIVLRLDKNKTSKNFKKSTDYQLRNK